MNTNLNFAAETPTSKEVQQHHLVLLDGKIVHYKDTKPVAIWLKTNTLHIGCFSITLEAAALIAKHFENEFKSVNKIMQ